jgi:hypothetical protein
MSMIATVTAITRIAVGDDRGGAGSFDGILPCVCGRSANLAISQNNATNPTPEISNERSSE